MTPQSKHYAVKYHWFREHIGHHGVKLVKIASADQLGNLFTKGLAKLAFTRLQKAAHGMVISHYAVSRGSMAGILPASYKHTNNLSYQLYLSHCVTLFLKTGV
jgi:hypothetical protein